MRVLSAARMRLYTSVINRFPYPAYHVLNNIAFHGFVYNANKRYECVVCNYQVPSWGRNNGRAAAQPEDLCKLIAHADEHLLQGTTRLPFEDFATCMPSPEVFCQLFNTSCWEQAVYMSIALKKLAEDPAVRERTFYDNPAALATLHPRETVEECVKRGLWYNGARRAVQCAFCTYSTNALGILHTESHCDFTRCPRLIDCAPGGPDDAAEGVQSSASPSQAAGAPSPNVDAREQRRMQRVDQLERALGRVCTSPAMFEESHGRESAEIGTSSSHLPTRVLPPSVERLLIGDGPQSSTPPPGFKPALLVPRHRSYLASASRLQGGRNWKPYMPPPSRQQVAATRYVSTSRYSMGRQSARAHAGAVSAPHGPTTRARAEQLLAATVPYATRLQQAQSGGVGTQRWQNPPQLPGATPTWPPPNSASWANSAASLSITSQAVTQSAHVAPVAGQLSPTPAGMLAVWQRLAREGYSADHVLQLLAKRTNEPLDTYDDFKHFEQKVAGQEYITLGPSERNCTVCLRNPITSAADPCGHMQFCVQCLQRMRKCPLCKRRISRRLRVFSPFS